MTSYRNKYLEMLKTEILAKSPYGRGTAKTVKNRSVLSKFWVLSSQDRPVSEFSPP